jgi:hypothetical protein
VAIGDLEHGSRPFAQIRLSGMIAQLDEFKALGLSQVNHTQERHTTLLHHDAGQGTNKRALLYPINL